MTEIAGGRISPLALPDKAALRTTPTQLYLRSS